VFFSVDVCTGLAFDARRAVDFTGEFSSADETVAKEF